MRQLQSNHNIPIIRTQIIQIMRGVTTSYLAIGHAGEIEYDVQNGCVKIRDANI